MKSAPHSLGHSRDHSLQDSHAGTVVRLRRHEKPQGRIMHAIVWVVGCLVVPSALAQNVPLPPQRPPNLVPAPPSGKEALKTPETPVRTPTDASSQPISDCPASLVALGMRTESAPEPSRENNACQVNNGVRLTAMRFNDRTVSFPDRPVLDCRAAYTVGLWLRDIVLPLTEARLGSPVAFFETGPGFECRNRNRAATGKLSAHASGLAIDVARVRLADKSALIVAKPEGEVQQQLLATLRRSACGWFTTVLGPGSDAAHADHLHLDVEQRGATGTGRYCQ